MCNICVIQVRGESKPHSPCYTNILHNQGYLIIVVSDAPHATARNQGSLVDWPSPFFSLIHHAQISIHTRTNVRLTR